MAGTGLHERLRRLRRRLLAVDVTSGVGWAVAAAFVFVLVCAWVDLVLELSSRLRIVSMATALVFGCVLVIRAAWLAFQAGSASAMAKRLDHVAQSGGQIRSGVDLLLQPRPASALTASLAEIAVDRAQRLADAVSKSTAVPAKPMCWAFGTVVLLVVVIGILGIFIPRMVKTQCLRFFDPYGDHPPFSNIVFQVEPGDERVMYGDRLDVRVTADGPVVDNIELVLDMQDATREETLPMFPEARQRWRATVGSVTVPGRYYVRAGRSRSHRFDITVVTVPRLEGVRFRITPPAYTNQSAYEGPLPQGGIAGLVGTRVEVFAKSNRPLSVGSIDVISGDERLQHKMNPVSSEGHEVQGSFEIRKPGRMELDVVDVAGQASRESFNISIAVLADERPFVRLLQPQAVSFATPDTALPIAVSAEDDYGITQLQLFRSLNDSRGLPAVMPISSPPQKRRYETLSLPLMSYGLSAGDEITLFARVEDNDPAGAKGSESPVAVVQIISQAKYEQLLLAKQGMEVLQGKYAEANRRLESVLEEIDKLQKELAQLPPDRPLSKSLREKLEQLSAKMREEAVAIRELADMELPFDIDKAFSKKLTALAKMLEQSAKQLKEQDKPESPGIGSVSGTLDKLKKVGKACSGGCKGFKKEVVAPLEHLARIFPLIEDQARFVAIYEQQKDLADRLASLKGRDGEDNPRLKARMRDLEAEQYQIREALRNLLADIEDHIARLPDDKRLDDLRRTATEFVQAVRPSGALEAMAEAEAGLAVFSGTRGYENANNAAEILNRFISRCQGMGQGAASCLKFSPSLSAGLGNSIQQLLASMEMSSGAQSGFGMGQGGGYSAQRTTLQNVGLYGNIPTLGDATTSTSAQGGAGGGPGRDGELAREDADPLMIDPQGKLQATGTSSALVPVIYRRQVGAYFQRIADELAGK